ncbi:MAG: YtxH domain-containing protein [Chloroflexi bacterium]|nr:YtxH domain-containing protein [Chloroflexota bacterium]
MNQRENSSDLVLGLVVGAFIGLAIGLLYAPRPGRETRQLLKERVEETTENAAEAIEKVKETAEDVKKKVLHETGGVEKAE